MRLIDADELLKHKGNCYDINGHLLYAVGTGNIMAAKTIDPVKHGKWLNTSTDIPKLLMNVCSECGFQYPSAIRPRFNYCPNCGASMDGGEDDESV